MAKKTSPPKKSDAKSETTLIRVSVDFAASIRDAASFEKVTVAEFATTHLMPVVEKRYRDSVVKEAKRMEGQK